MNALPLTDYSGFALQFIDRLAYLEYASATHEVLSARLLAGLT